MGVVIFHFPRKILRAWLEEKLRTREHNEEGKESTSVPRRRLFRINFPPNMGRGICKSHNMLFSLYYLYVCLRPTLPTWVRFKTPNYWNVVQKIFDCISMVDLWLLMSYDFVTLWRYINQLMKRTRNFYTSQQKLLLKCIEKLFLSFSLQFCTASSYS